MARKSLNLRLAKPVSDYSTVGAFEVAASGFAGALTFSPADTPNGYNVNSDGRGDLTTPLSSGVKVVYIRAEDGDGYALGMKFTLTAPDSGSLRIPEISTMSGGREAVVPWEYYRKQADEAFNPAVHTVSDPASPTCAIYTHKAVKSGNWSDPTAWDTGTIPHSLTDGTAVVCTNGFDIVYDMLSDVRIKDIHVNGGSTFRFATTQTRLWVDTIMCDGKWIMGDVSAPIPDSGLIVSGKRVPQCEIVFWASEAPLATTRLGLNTMGPVRIHGAAKKHKLHTPASVLAGATSITFEEDVAGAGWKVGDEIMVVATEWQATASTDAQYTGPAAFYGPLLGGNGVRTRTLGYKQSQDEVRTIASIDGNTVHFIAPLAYNHFLYTDTLPRGDVVTLKPCVAMLTHSIRFRTAGSADTAIWSGANLADRQKRAHIMFMFDDDIQCRYAESKNMGRTDVDPSLVTPDEGTKYADAASTVQITDPLNVRGRYPWHMHRNGAYFGRKMVVFENLTAWAPTSEVPIPGWAITHHDARGAVDNCVVYNVRGAGIVSELGNEIGQWINNVVSWCRGDGFAYDWGSRAEQWTNHNGHQGVAYESQARQILQQDNIASSSHVGWMYMQQNTNGYDRTADVYSLRYRDPIAQSVLIGISNYGVPGSGILGDFRQAFVYGGEQPSVPDFVRNHAFACTNWFAKAHSQGVDRTDKTPFIIRGGHAINCATAYNIINYTFVYYIYDTLWIGRDQASSVGATIGSVTWELPFINMKLKRMLKGFVDAGHSLGYNTFWIDVATEDVTTPFPASPVNVGKDPTTHVAYNVMGPWTVTGVNTAIVREWGSISTASLPSPYPLAPFGPSEAFRAANPCPAYGEQPYVVIDGTPDLTVTPLYGNQITFRAVIVDSVGYRLLGDSQSPESGLSGVGPFTSRKSSENSDGYEMVRRNGCFNDGGTWKSRLWFNDLDRATGNHFTFSIDVTLSGFDAGFLAANTVDPNATKPVTPLVPEITRNTPIVPDTVPPTILSGNTFHVAPGVPMKAVLDANDGRTRWSVVGGADASHFEVAEGRYLRWSANGTRSKSSPSDADSDGVYEVRLRATKPGGAYTEQDVTVSPDYWRDDFNGPDREFLQKRVGWTLVDGNSWRIILSGRGIRNGWSNGANRAHNFKSTFPCLGPNQSTRFKVFERSRSEVRLRYTDENNHIAVSITDSPDNFVVYEKVGGTKTERARYTKPANIPATTFRCDVIGNTFAVYYDGVLRTPSSGAGTLSGSLPDSNDVGLSVGYIGSASEWLDWIEFETLA